VTLTSVNYCYHETFGLMPRRTTCSDP